MRGILRVEIIVLATLPAILPVGRRHLQNRHTGLLHEAQQARAVAAGRLDADALEVADIRSERWPASNRNTRPE